MKYLSIASYIFQKQLANTTEACSYLGSSKRSLEPLLLIVEYFKTYIVACQLATVYAIVNCLQYLDCLIQPYDITVRSIHAWQIENFQLLTIFILADKAANPPMIFSPNFCLVVKVFCFTVAHCMVFKCDIPCGLQMYIIGLGSLQIYCLCVASNGDSTYNLSVTTAHH